MHINSVYYQNDNQVPNQLSIKCDPVNMYGRQSEEAKCAHDRKKRYFPRYVRLEVSCV